MIFANRPAALLLATLALAMPLTPALAHDDATMDAMKAPNGGQLRMAGIYHFELVLAKNGKEGKDSPVMVYLTDHAGAKIPTAGASGTATLLSGKNKATITLSPDGDNRLKGAGSYTASPELKAVVSITVAGKPAEQARFTPMAANVNPHAEHKH